MSEKTNVGAGWRSCCIRFVEKTSLFFEGETTSFGSILASDGTNQQQQKKNSLFEDRDCLVKEEVISIRDSITFSQSVFAARAHSCSDTLYIQSKCIKHQIW